MATWALHLLVKACCNTPRKVSSSPTAGIKAMTNRLKSNPPTVSTSSIRWVRSPAMSSICLSRASRASKASPKFTPLGAYIISETPGTGILPEDSLYVRLNYTCSTLDGTVETTTDVKTAKKCGLYDKTNYYGPLVAYRGENQESLAAGVEEALSTMRIGGRKTVIIPGWLTEVKRYDTPEKYVENCSGTDYIYEFELVDCFNDVDRWERDSLLRFLAVNYPAAKEDTTYTGFFYVKTRDGEDKTFSSDTTIYINYTGRLLNNRAFDTTIADTAKVWGLYSASKTYQQTKINWYADGQDFTKITMTDSETSTITGFAYGLNVMHPGEAGICFFII